MASYFSYFPNVYVGEGVADEEAFKYRLVKNIFRKVKPRSDLSRFTTLFEAYEIESGETPSTLAQKFFNDPFLDWAILLINDIIDVYEEWPKEQDQLETFVNTKYGDPDGIHHYETNEVLYNNVVVFKKGIEVNDTFRASLPDGTTLSESQSIYPVSNYEYEYYENEKKRQILIPLGNMIDIMVEEFEDLVSYEPHAELDDANNKKTPLSIASRFLNNVGTSSSGSITITNQISGNVTSYDNGPGSSVLGIGVNTTII